MVEPASSNWQTAGERKKNKKQQQHFSGWNLACCTNQISSRALCMYLNGGDVGEAGQVLRVGHWRNELDGAHHRAGGPPVAMCTGHTGAGGAGGVGSTDVVQGWCREGADVAGVGMLQGKEKMGRFRKGGCGMRLNNSWFCNVKRVTLTCLWSCDCIMGYGWPLRRGWVTGMRFCELAMRRWGGGGYMWGPPLTPSLCSDCILMSLGG